MTEAVGKRAGVSFARLVPSVLLPPEDPSGAPTRRTVRDWIVDSFAFLFALVIGLLAYTDTASSAVHHERHGLLVLDAAVALIGCIALWWRRRWPVHIAVLTALVSVVSGGSGGPAAVAMFTVAVHRRTSVAIAVSALNVVAGVLLVVVRPQHQALWVA